MLSLGIDIGSSSVKVSVYDPDLGRAVGSGQYPDHEMTIVAEQAGWAEQDPEWWWDAFLKAFARAVSAIDSRRIETIGIAYQMHGLVCLDDAGVPLRPSIIWCDSRAVETGRNAFEAIGHEYALTHLLNSPGNFTASKLAWVKQHESAVFKRIKHICLPGDFIAFRLTQTLTTTIGGLSEGVFYDFRNRTLSRPLLDYFGFDEAIFPKTGNNFGEHGRVTAATAHLLQVSPEATVTYKAGDQPNNALSLRVLRPGEIAASAGTSGVVYGVSDDLFIDRSQRVNSFAHVNYTPEKPSIGILLCINGVGIANSWVKKMTRAGGYDVMNEQAANIRAGSDGLYFLPFGNGAERMLSNSEPGAGFHGLNFNRHDAAHLYRAVQEGIAFAFLYGMQAFEENNISITAVRAGMANLFLSPVFTKVFSTLFGVPVELYETDGATGAARGALIGAGRCSIDEAFKSLRQLETVEPDDNLRAEYAAHFQHWKNHLDRLL